MSDDLDITKLIPGKDDKVAIMACVGHVCIQWSLLENNILRFLAVLEGVKFDHAAIMFGGMDMKPRLGTAINLAQFHKIHHPLQRRLVNLRKRMEKDNLQDRRNLVVHGVHEGSERPHSFKLYMPRLKGDQKNAEISVSDVILLGLEIKAAGDEISSIMLDYVDWKMRDHNTINEVS